jgi:periplasmic protein TonB
MTRRLIAFALLICTTSLVAAQLSPKGVRVAEEVMEGLLVKKVAPVYPPLAKPARIQGTVLLQVNINKTGDVEHVQLISGHPMLAQSAIDAVKQWKYQPYLLNGQPIDVETKVRVNFTLAV